MVEIDHGDKSVPRCIFHPFVFNTPKKRYDHHFFRGKHIYSSARWTRLRASYIVLNPICERCFGLGIIEPVFVVDHIKEIRDGGDPWDMGNLQSLCRNCHQIKTGEVVRQRANKIKNNGFGSISDF